MKTTGIPSPSTFLTLPSELIEAVLISSRSPRTVASIAQTCQALHTLVYASPDSHLWRELFLTIWDDPRPALGHRSLVDPRIDPTTWDWGTEYRRRVSTDKWLKGWRRNICPADETPAGKDANTNTEWCTVYITTLSVLSTVLNTLLTLQPFPATPSLTQTVLAPATISAYPTGNTGSGVSGRREVMANAPPLPPLLIVLASGIPAFNKSRSGIRVGRMVYGPHASRAQAEELPPIPTPSLPPQLMRTLLASHVVGVRGSPTHVPSLSGADFGGELLGDIFYQIICITGFVPIPPPLFSTCASTCTCTATAPFGLGTQDDGERGREDEHCASGEQSKRPTFEAFPTPSQQHADARVLARRRVYDMRYLRADRLWGPFQPVTRESLGARPGATRLHADGKGKPRTEGKRTGSGAASRHGGARLGTLAWSVGVDIEPDDFDSSSDDSKDEDWHDPADSGNGSTSTSSGNHKHEQINGGQDATGVTPEVEMESTEPEHSHFSFIHAPGVTPDAEPTTSTTPTVSSRRTRRSNPRLPPNSAVSLREIRPQHLRPDYAYLASARIVVEANLRELFGSEISDDVVAPTSEIGAPGTGMFWEDEDEILRARAGSLEPVSSIFRASPSPTTTPSGIPPANSSTSTFELADILSRFQSLEVVRLGSACGYWNGWTKRQQSEMRIVDENADVSSSLPSEDGMEAKKQRIVAERDQLEKSIKGTTTADAKGKGKERDGTPAAVPGLGNDPGLGDWEIGHEGEACEGWDWAGVAGVWRRCVCWMDYRELLFFNLDPAKFLDLDAQEACRIIAMELRITGYTRAGLMPVYDAKPAREHINAFSRNKRSKTSVRTGYFRPPPVIHFSGSSIGSDRGLDDRRSVKGSVQLIGGGEVRWQMDTYIHDSTLPGVSAPEWSSEAVQIGGIGSAVGILGMWTGAGHERADPLGPFWAWRVT